MNVDELLASGRWLYLEGRYVEALAAFSQVHDATVAAPIRSWLTPFEIVADAISYIGRCHIGLEQPGTAFDWLSARMRSVDPKLDFPLGVLSRLHHPAHRLGFLQGQLQLIEVLLAELHPLTEIKNLLADLVVAVTREGNDDLMTLCMSMQAFISLREGRPEDACECLRRCSQKRNPAEPLLAGYPPERYQCLLALLYEALGRNVDVDACLKSMESLALDRWERAVVAGVRTRRGLTTEPLPHGADLEYLRSLADLSFHQQPGPCNETKLAEALRTSYRSVRRFVGLRALHRGTPRPRGPLEQLLLREFSVDQVQCLPTSAEDIVQWLSV